MAKFTFKLRNPKSDTDTAIFLVVNINGKRLVYPTYKKINPAYWNQKGQVAKTTVKFTESPQFNLKIGNIKQRANKVLMDFEDSNTFDADINKLRESLDIEFERKEKVRSEKPTLFSFIEKFIEQAKTRINEKTGKPLARSTISSSNQCLDSLKEFSKKTQKPIDFESIDLDFYYDFRTFLSEQGLAINTIGGRIKKLKWFLNAATEIGLNTKQAYKSKKFVATQVLTETIYLSEKELEEMYKLDLSKNERLERVRDLFLIGCWTGLRFSDFSTLSKSQIQDEFITVTTQKTGETVVIPIYPVVKEIMRRYKGKTPNSLPRSLSNVKMNEYLKELGEMVESLSNLVTLKTLYKGKEVIKEYKRYQLLTTHTARRSFATNLYLDGVKPQIIMKITGHRTEAAFMRYIRVTAKESAESLLLHWKNKIKPNI